MNDGYGGERVGGNNMTGLHCWRVWKLSVLSRVTPSIFTVSDDVMSHPSTHILDGRSQSLCLVPKYMTSDLSGFKGRLFCQNQYTTSLWNSVQDEQCLIAMVRWELCITVCRQNSNDISLLDCQSTVQLMRHKQWKDRQTVTKPEPRQSGGVKLLYWNTIISSTTPSHIYY